MNPAESTRRETPSVRLLIVANFEPDVGYAWNTIGNYFVALGRMAREQGAHALICFPQMNDVPARFASEGIETVRFDFWSGGILGLYRFVRDRRVRCVYLTDRPLFSLRYLVCRLAGAERIVVHDRTSGERSAPGPLKQFGKRVVNRTPFAADAAIAISDYVRERLIRVSCFPPGRIVRIWNGVDIRKFIPGKDDYVRETYRIPRDSRIVFAHCRANAYKGIPVLIRAASKLLNGVGRKDVVFLYCGDGPDLDRFRALVREEGLEGRFLCPGKADFVERIIRGVDLVVVPSVWQEGFGLSVVEGMAAGKPVVASRVGGIVEILSDGVDGHLVPAGDPDVLAERIARLLDDDVECQRLGEAARRTAVERFDIEDKKRELAELFRRFVPAQTRT